MAGFTTVGAATTTPIYGFNADRFTADVSDGGSVNITGGSISLGINTSFDGLSTSINNKTYYLGQTFTSGLSNPEVKKYSGNSSILIIDQQSHVLLIKKKISKLYYSSNNSWLKPQI